MAWGTGCFDASYDGLGPFLTTLVLDGNALPCQLPQHWGRAGAFPNVTRISMQQAQLSSTLPKGWGVAGAFPALQELALDDNPQLTGAVTKRLGLPVGT